MQINTVHKRVNTKNVKAAQKWISRFRDGNIEAEDTQIGTSCCFWIGTLKRTSGNKSNSEHGYDGGFKIRQMDASQIISGKIAVKNKCVFSVSVISWKIIIL